MYLGPLASYVSYYISPTIDTNQVFYWTDWPCADQYNPGPDMAALPAYVAVCHAIVAATSKEYFERAWCHVELMMAYSFMSIGRTLFLLEEGFVEDITFNTVEAIAQVVLDPLQCAMTNENDRSVITRLR